MKGNANPLKGWTVKLFDDTGCEVGEAPLGGRAFVNNANEIMYNKLAREVGAAIAEELEFEMTERAEDDE